MAEDKKSFLLYADLIHTVRKMPKEKAGELLLHILEYVNDTNPQTDDMIINIAFEPIKQQMKRDLLKWEDVKSKRSEAGKLSAEARRLKKESEQKLTNPTSVNKAQQDSTNPTVNDNVTVTVINKEKDMYKSGKPDPVDYQKFIEVFNSFGKKSYRVTDKLKIALNARLKDYTRSEILKAIENAHKDPFHIDSGFKHLDPLFMLRPDKIERFLNFIPPVPELQLHHPRLAGN